MNEKTLDISWGTIIKVFAAVLLFYVIYLSREIALWFFFALAISVLFEPGIAFLRKIRVPKILAIIIIYFSIFGIVGLLIYVSAPIFISEIRQFSQHLPEYFEQINPILKQLGADTASDFNDVSSILTKNLQENSQSIIRALTVFFGGLAATITILAMAFFLSLEERATERVLLLLFPKRHEDQIRAIFERVQRKVAGWFGARILACLFVGIASYIIFYIFGVKYALVLALISGFLNFIPYIGPWVTGVILLFFIAISSSWLTAVYVLLAFVVIQTIENSILTPLLMKKMTDIPPVLVLLSLLMGAKLFGVLGMVFAVPIFGIIYEFAKEFLERRRQDPVPVE